MFIYFNEHKLAYHKGQLAPFFIVIIIVLIIAALITVNIGKVAKIKTYSSNAVDAGALAGASTMASAFNYIAVANSFMIVNYEFFFAMASVSFAIADIAMGIAIGATIAAVVQLNIACALYLCCMDPLTPECCPPMEAAIAAAVAEMTTAMSKFPIFTASMASLMFQVEGYYLTQKYFYKMIRETVDNYYKSALKSSYSFAFNNSGIGQKLSNELPEIISQQDSYMIWLRLNLKDVECADIKTYHWKDAPGRREGQRRMHDVAVRVSINPVERYRLGKTSMGRFEEWATLGAADASNGLAAGLLEDAIAMAAAEPCDAVDFATGAIAAEGVALGASIRAHFGLTPGGSFTDSSGDVGDNMITWIEDVPHDGRVSVLQTQRHQGANLGMWSTEYPIISSSSTGLFLILGCIFPPKPTYDSTLIAVDSIKMNLLLEPYPIKDVEDDLQEEMRNN